MPDLDWQNTMPCQRVSDCSQVSGLICKMGIGIGLTQTMCQ